MLDIFYDLLSMYVNNILFSVREDVQLKKTRNKVTEKALIIIIKNPHHNVRYYYYNSHNYC